MGQQARELDNRHQGNRNACPLCTPRRPGTVRADQLWAWSLAHPGQPPLRP